MNTIVYPMKVLAVKLEYRRLKLEKIPHGYFRIIKGKKYVVINYDPAMPKINTKHPRVIRVTTKLGTELSEAVNAYLSIRSEYESLLSMWKNHYGFEPPRVKFPIVQFADPHGMNNGFFDRQREFCGKYQPENPTVSDHGELKSKNEQMGADLLKLMGIPFKYEPEVYLKEANDTINPDYLIDFYEIDRCSYLEILGMSDKPEYIFKNANKINGYSKDTYRPGREVIYVFLYDKQNFDGDYFVSEVLSAFNNMIPDSALVWGIDAGGLEVDGY